MKTGTALLLFFSGALLSACSGGNSVRACADSIEPTTTTRQASSGGRCRGSARACNLYSAATCHQQKGCSPVFGDLMTYSDDRCDGRPPSCDTRSSQSECEEVRGCRWEEGEGTSGAGSSTSSGGATAAGPATVDCTSNAGGGGAASPGSEQGQPSGPGDEPSSGGSSGTPGSSSSGGSSSGGSSSGGSSSSSSSSSSSGSPGPGPDDQDAGGGGGPMPPAPGG